MMSSNLTGNVLLFILGLLFIFHLFVLSEVIPHDIVWAGKIKTQEQLIILESISLFILAISFTIVAHKIGLIDFGINPKVINVGIWILFALFTLNTIGNLTAKNNFEKYGFGFLTLVMMLLTLKLAITPKKK
ncbi:MAG: hypothetical protein AB8F94_20150 [Saprospiraceae bacterium]